MRARLKLDPEFVESQKRFDRMGTRARRPEPALRAPATREDLQAASGRKFQRGLRRDSRGWVLEKRREGKSTRTMVYTGAAEQALVYNRGPARGSVSFNAHNAELRWGIPAGRNDLFYIPILARRKPARRVVVIDKTARENIAERVLTYVDEGDITR